MRKWFNCLQLNPVYSGSEDVCKLKVAKLEKALRACDDSDPDEAHVLDEVTSNQSDKGYLLYHAVIISYLKQIYT